MRLGLTIGIALAFSGLAFDAAAKGGRGRVITSGDEAVREARKEARKEACRERVRASTGRGKENRDTRRAEVRRCMKGGM